MTEHEFKWDCSPSKFKEITLTLNIDNFTKIKMLSEYFDTHDEYLKKKRGSLRLRYEDDTLVCCLKLTISKEGALASRYEFEVNANNLTDGLKKLAQNHDISDVCNHLLSVELYKLCKIEFTRNVTCINMQNFNAELCFDEGVFFNNSKSLAFTEMECEFSSGDLQKFMHHCINFEHDFCLKSQPYSKLARAMSL